MQSAQTASPLFQMFPLVLIFVIFYFMLIKPQKNKEKLHQQMVAELKKNDEIVTSSGIHAVVVGVKEKTLTLRIDDNVKIEVEKNCVGYLKKKNA